MTDALRQLFDGMVADEPVLRTGPDELVTTGRRLHTRRRAVMGTAGAVLAAVAVVTVTALPRLALTNSPSAGQPSASASARRPSPSPAHPNPSASRSTAKPSVAPATWFQTCGKNTPASLPATTKTTLPDPQQMATAIIAAAPRVAPGQKLILIHAGRVETSEKAPGVAIVGVIVHIEDADGRGELHMTIRGIGGGGTPLQRAEAELDNQLPGCALAARRQLPDGSIAQYRPFGNADADRDVKPVWYYSIRGFDLQVSHSLLAYEYRPDATEPYSPAVVGKRRSTFALTVEQVFELTTVAADAR